MKHEMIRAAAEGITMSAEAKQRIAENCRKAISTKTEEQSMKTNSKTSFIRKPAVIFAAIALCICFCATAAIAAVETKQGFFRGITDFRGAVTGTAYEAAADEIILEAAAEGDILSVDVTFSDPAKPPYSECEQLSIANYRIADAEGKTVAEGSSAEAAAATDGRAVIAIPVGDLDSGSYRLIITVFTSEKKADQPLNIYGLWECEFVK